MEHEQQPNIVEPKLETILEGIEEEFNYKEVMKHTCRLCQAQLKNANDLKRHMAHHSKLKTLLKLVYANPAQTKFKDHSQFS